MKNKGILIGTVIIIVISVIIFLFVTYCKRKGNLIENLGISNLYIINGDIKRANELLNNYDYINERNLPNHNGLIHKEGFTYYDSNNKIILKIFVMDNEKECYIINSEGKTKYYDMKKKDNPEKKYSVSILSIDWKNGKEEQIAYNFLHLIKDDKENISYDSYETNVELKLVANKSIKVENYNNAFMQNEISNSTYSSPFWHNFSIYSYNSDLIAKNVYEKYIKDLKKYCDELNPNQFKIRTFKIENEQFSFIYDNYNSKARGIIGTHENQMFIFNFLVENIGNNKENTEKYFDFLKENEYFKNDEIKDFVLNLFIDKNLYNKENYDK